MLEKFSEEQRRLFLKEIQGLGFISDELVGKEIDKQVYGVNITCAWPLPTEIKETYEGLYDKLKELEGVYIYPYSQTHITILTIVNFKKRLNQPKQYLDDETRGLLTSKIRQLIKQKPIKVFIDSPVLLRSASFLPIYNPTREIYEIREQAIEILNSINRGYILDIPPAIHATILRFREAPANITGFIRRFEEITKGFSAEGFVKEIYLTEELKPYMREVNILERI